VDFALKKDRNATRPNTLYSSRPATPTRWPPRVHGIHGQDAKQGKEALRACPTLKFKELVQNSVTDKAKVRSKGEREI